MDKDTVLWQDRQRNYLSANMISDRYLLNILRFICNGGGYYSFLSEQVIDNLFAEADKRELKHSFNKNDAIFHYRFKGLDNDMDTMELNADMHIDW